MPLALPPRVPAIPATPPVDTTLLMQKRLPVIVVLPLFVKVVMQAVLLVKEVLLKMVAHDAQWAFMIQTAVILLFVLLARGVPNALGPWLQIVLVLDRVAAWMATIGI